MAKGEIEAFLVALDDFQKRVDGVPTWNSFKARRALLALQNELRGKQSTYNDLLRKARSQVGGDVSSAAGAFGLTFQLMHRLADALYHISALSVAYQSAGAALSTKQAFAFGWGALYVGIVLSAAGMLQAFLS